MHNVDSADHIANRFQDGNPGTGQPATVLASKFMNCTMDELANMVLKAGMALDVNNNAQVQEALQILGRRDAGLKNKLIDADFKLWWNTSVTKTAFNGYPDGPPAWRIFTGTSPGQATISRQTFAIGQSQVDGNPKHFLRFLQSVAPGGGSNPALTQRIEGVGTLSGKKVTISVWLKADSTRSVTPRLQQDFGTGGSPSGPVNTDGTPFSVTTSWQKFKVTLTLPSTSGSTLGTDGNDHLAAQLILPAATFTIDVADFQVEEGEVASPFERRPASVDERMLGRYVESSYAFGTALGAVTKVGCIQAFEDSGPVWQGMQRPFRSGKRTIPAEIWYAPSNGAAGFIDIGTPAVPTAVTTVLGLGETSTGAPNASSVQTSVVVEGHYLADARL